MYFGNNIMNTRQGFGSFKVQKLIFFVSIAQSQQYSRILLSEALLMVVPSVVQLY